MNSTYQSIINHTPTIVFNYKYEQVF